MTLGFATQLAWRNIWRQKRRTLITAAAVAVAMLLALFMRSMQEGSYARNLDNSTRFFSGYLQLQNVEFSENKSIDWLLPADDEFRSKVKSIDGVTYAVPRIESFALASAGQKSKGVFVMGAHPQEEDAYSGLAARVKDGTYFQSDNEKSVLIGGRLAKYFNLGLGDEIVLYGQGYHGVTAAGVFNIVGILNYPNSQLDSRIIYLPLKTAQDLYATGNQVTSWVLHGKNARSIPKIKAAALEKMPDDITVKTWDEISPELAQQVSLDRAGGQFIVIVLYIVVGFGLFATIVMMTLERKREFAVMLAAGMIRRKLALLIGLESFYLAMTGVILGMALTLPLLIYFYFNPIPLSGDIALMMDEMGWEPIIPFSLDPRLFLMHIGLVIFILMLCITYPLIKIKNMKIAESLKS